MKKKLFLMVVMTFVFAIALTFAVSAEGTVHNSTTVDYTETVTLSQEFTLADGTTTNTVPLFDGEDALIWYLDGSVLKSIHADDPQVKYKAAGKYWVQIPDCYGNKVSGVEINGVEIIFDDGSKIAPDKLVVFNIMDDDVKVNYNVDSTSDYYGQPVVCMKNFLQYKNNIQYIYLRLDTIAIMSGAFTNDVNLKYINLEDLTELREIGDSNNFSGCTSLFDNYVLDLSRTNLTTIDNGNSFEGVQLKGIILPETVINISKQTFKNCTKLETVTLCKKSDKTTTIGESIFDGCTALKAIYYVGTESDFGTLNINATGNSQFTNKISYADYKTLSDEEKASNTYAVYNYSWCLAYNNGVHGTTTATNACVGTCQVCGDTVVNHTEAENLTVAIEYAKGYTEVGTKTTLCNNDGCTYSETAEADALFTNQGFSTQESGGDSIVICYLVNQKAITAYEATGKTVEYGVFAVLKTNLIDVNENVVLDPLSASGVIKADLTDYGFDAFNLKITGFETEAQKDAKIVLGAYVTVSDKTYYMQDDTNSTKGEADSYYYTSYNMMFPTTTEAN